MPSLSRRPAALHPPLALPLALGIALLAALPQARAQTAEPAVQPDEVVQSLETTFGVHPGQRRNHIKGTCASGSFVGTPAGAALSRSALFSGEPVPVVARFSLAGGNPQVPDAARSARGMALEFRLPQGERQHMTMLDIPIFGAAHPETFNAMIQAARPDPATGKPDPARLAAALKAHPEALAQADYMAGHLPPASYGNATFYSIHTFRFIDAQQTPHLVKWRFVPQDGPLPLETAELASAPHDFLQERLLTRLAQGPLRWDMWVILGEPGDVPDNPTLAWPESRPHQVAGTLSIGAATPQAGAECEKINFDPLVMADGIAPTDDPILLFRSPAYALSFSRRLTGQ